MHRLQWKHCEVISETEKTNEKYKVIFQCKNKSNNASITMEAL